MDPGPTYLRRLTNTEYANTVRDLVQSMPGLTDDFPLDFAKNGFDNNSEVIGMSISQVDAYRVAAEKIATTVTASSTLRAKVLGCDPFGTSRTACLNSFIQTFGRRLWRRALSDGEVTALVAVADTAKADADPYASVQLVLRALFQSPDFLFRVEDSSPTTAPRPLTGYELATRLSFALWQTTPDEALLTAAESGALGTVEGLKSAAQRLLADPRAKASLRRFHDQWLRLELVDAAQVSATTYPLWSDALRASMREEAARLVDDAVWTTSTNYLDLFTTTKTYVDSNLAQVYGVSPPASGWSAVELPPDQRRSGLLTLPALMTATGRPNGTSPIIRGRFVRELFLCEKLPSPPPNIPLVPDPVEGETERERLARHRTDPACSACHALLEPLGFGLAQYDQVGGYHSTDTYGNGISTAGVLTNYPPEAFDGPVELGQRLKGIPGVSTCVSLEVFRYLFGRTETMDDLCAVATADERFRGSGFHFTDLLVEYIGSDTFRMRTSKADVLDSGGSP